MEINLRGLEQKMTKVKPTVIDLFCGAGGMSEGFRQAGFNVVWANDFEEKFCKTHSLNHKGCKSVSGDIRKITSERIRKDIGKKTVDVIIGGPPCQGFSHAGKRDKKDPRNSLFMEFIRIVKDLQPKWIVMENVLGILTMTTEKGESVKDIIKNELEHADGYKVKFFKLTSSNYGVPQKRRRVFFIATNTGKAIEEPEQTHSEKPKVTIEGKKLKLWTPVESILIPKEEVPKNYFHGPKMIEGFVRRKKRNLEKGKGFGPQYLKMDKPSYTISARYWKDGADALVKYSESDIRMLTELEAARIQGFPDDYKFNGSKKEVYTQIGNAVAVGMAKAIGEDIIKKLRSVK